MTKTTSRAELRQKIIDKMNTLVLPKPVERKPRQTIEELEKILNQEDPPNIQINSDGSVTEYRPQTTTVGKVADAILELWDDYLTEITNAE
jgi:hypothetical protein